MTERFKNLYRIETNRALWHKYDGGQYFVTICTAGREHYFGKIDETGMHLSEIGVFAQEQFTNVSTYYPYAEIPSFVIMPNHIHAIVQINKDSNVIDRGSTYEDNSVLTTKTGATKTGGATGQYNPMNTHCLGTVIRGLKARVSRFANKNGITFGWQSRFHDHIIRDQHGLECISKYIDNNVANWQLQKRRLR